MTTQRILPFQLRRTINPPPSRLVFEPTVVSTIPFTNKKQHNTNTAAVATLNRKFPLTTEASQGSVPIPSRQGISTTSTLPQSVPPAQCCESSPRDTSVDVRGVVYMLHGWAQNIHVFSNRVRKLTKRLNKAGYRVVFLQGPHRLPPIVATSTSADGEGNGDGGNDDNNDDSSSSFSREYAYAWFLYNTPCDGDNQDGDQSAAMRHPQQPPVLQPSPTGDFRGMDASLAFLRNELRADRNEFRKMDHLDAATPSAVIPPFFLFGFSQGAVLVHKVATLACESAIGDTEASGCDSRGPWTDVQKCILVSGFSFTTSIRLNMGTDVYKTNGDDHDDHLTESLQISGSAESRRTMPSFHVVGRKDSRVSPHLTLELHSLEPCFDVKENHRRVLWEHDRGHVVPQNQDFCNRLLEFLAVP